MKGASSLCVYAFWSIFPMYFTISWTLYSSSGSWCPYQVEKLVPCRVRNGTEPYYGTNICWRNENGSYACTKKLMYRPKYTTTYKKIMETKYRCCPGRDGPHCENECFNCTSFRKLEERISVQERRLGRLEKSVLLQKSQSVGVNADRFYKDISGENSVYSVAATPASSSVAHDSERKQESLSLSLAYATLNLRVQTILDEFREMQNRIRYLENEVSRLNTQVDDLSLGGNISYDYGGGNNNLGTGSSDMHLNTDSRRNNPVASSSTSKDRATSLQNEMTTNVDNGITSTNRNIIDGRHDHETRHYRHHHDYNHLNHRHHHDNQDSVPSTTMTHDHFSLHHHSSAKSDNAPFRVLEENLERGDIASTLNDDYGDDLYNDNSTEQYIDQLQAKREHHMP